MYADGKYIPEPFKPRRYTQDKLTKGKLVKVSQQRKFLEQLDDLTAAVFGDLQCNLRTKHNRTLASK